MQTQEKHIFAFFWHHENQLPSYSNGDTIRCTDEQLLHRMHTVLRLTHHDECIFFDRTTHCNVRFEEVTKKYSSARVLACTRNTPIAPSITFLLPLLKREALHEAVYGLTEVGCTTIQLITTEKMHVSWQGQKELEKLQKIMIAAAEQAKYYSFGHINPPLPLKEVLKTYNQQDLYKIFLDAEGATSNEILTPMLKLSKSYIVLAGPEGDLTPEEKKYVKEANFNALRLTPTILRAPQAAILATGVLRSLLPVIP
jgi:RsmE family RNA methyltransferase